VDEAARARGHPVPAAAPGRGLLPLARFIIRNRMARPRYLRLWLRYVWRFKVRYRHIVTRGMVFVDRRAEVYCRRGLGHMELGRWVWIGAGNALRCHEGFFRIGDKVVFGASNTLNGYLDVDVGDDCIFADWIYVTDFDHVYDDPAVPIRRQGIVKSPVRIEADCWIGEKASILRGVTVGRGSVVGAQTVVNRDVPPRSVVVGNPGRVVKRRGG
jgi:acetyltransferase-like isoleucine patch superfamily enzyme